MRNYFSLTCWRTTCGQFVLIRADADWLEGSWYGVTVGLLGFCACLTFRPNGKDWA